MNKNEQLIKRTVETYYRDTKNSSFIVSPDGKTLVELTPFPHTLTITENKTGKKQVLIENSSFRISNLAWSPDGSSLLFLSDASGHENLRFTSLICKTGTLIYHTSEHHRVHSYFTSSEVRNTALLIANCDDQTLYTPYLLDLTTSELTRIEENSGNVKEWIPDHTLALRARVTFNADGAFTLEVKNSSSHIWEEQITWSHESAFATGPLFIAPDNKTLYLTTDTNKLIGKDISDTSSLVALDLETGSLSHVLGGARFDVGTQNLYDLIQPNTFPQKSALFSPRSRDLIAFSYHEEKLRWHIITDEGNDLVQAIAPQGKSKDSFWVADNTCPDLWVIGTCRSDVAPSFYLYNRKTGKQTQLHQTYPHLSTQNLVKTVPVQFSARDGLLLDGYLTDPSPEKQKPLLVHVHGGPWGRITEEFKTETQLYASLGYAVLQINFRGSAGYGKQLVNAGNKSWGTGMIDDLADAAHWAIEQNICAPDQIAIIGHSYGGYAAAMGALRYPELFQAVVSTLAPLDLDIFLNNLPPYWRSFAAHFEQRVASLDSRDAQLRKDHSPTQQIEQLKRPLLLINTENDIRVTKDIFIETVSRLRKTDCCFETLFIYNEGHRAVHPDHHVEFFSRIALFLDKFLPAR